MSDSAEVRAALGLLEAEFGAEIEARTTPGLSAAVVLGEATIWARGFGLADLERGVPATPGTVYAIGSITKLFTATMLMQLRDAGKLRLDDPVQSYVPDIKVPRRHAGAAEITFRHLVTHTAGLPKDAPLGYWAGLEFPSPERVMASFADTEQPYPPGRHFKYSNYGVALLGHTLSRIAGQDWDSYIQAHILAPLGMRDTAPWLNDALRPKAATGYARPVTGWPPVSYPPIDLGGISFGGSMVASVENMAKFMAEQFAERPRILARSTIEEMQRVVWLHANWREGRGIGWGIHRADEGTTRLEHGGGVHGFTCRAVLSPVDRLGVCVFTNGSEGEVGGRLAARALNLLAPILRRAEIRRAPRPAGPAPEAWRRYTGRYRWLLGDAEVVIHGGELVLRMLGPAVEETALLPAGEQTFALGGAPAPAPPTGPFNPATRTQVHGEPVRFVLDEAGRVRQMWVGPHPYTPIE